MILGPKEASRSLHQVQWCHCPTNDILRDIERLYNHEFEHADGFRNEYSVEDKRALEIVNSSFRLQGGYFQVGLPWKYDKPRLPNNLEAAERRLECLRKRFMKDNSLLEKYQLVMSKHLSKGYIIEASKEEFDRDAVCWYIPHHPVINPKKPGKLRIVFDCAAVYQDCSVNDQLLRGPSTVNSFIGLLLRFRLCNVALAANFALGKTVDIFGKELNKVVQEVVDKSFYVDDYLTSIDNVQDAIELATTLGLLLRKSGFRLTKWISNCLQVLESIHPEERAEAVKEIDFERLSTERTLGLFWNTTVDVNNKRDPNESEITIGSAVSSVAVTNVASLSTSDQDEIGCLSVENIDVGGNSVSHSDGTTEGANIRYPRCDEESSSMRNRARNCPPVALHHH
ncbi:unnamed protein product [Schistosoma turkestanicum]|nr:unnamed protein product [Schistosoma turkestanicum]